MAETRDKGGVEQVRTAEGPANNCTGRIAGQGTHLLASGDSFQDWNLLGDEGKTDT